MSLALVRKVLSVAQVSLRDMIFLVCGITASALIEVIAITAVFALLTTAATPDSTLTRIPFASRLMERLPGGMEGLAAAALLIAALYIVKAGLFLAVSHYKFGIGAAVMRHVHERIISAYLARPYRFYLNSNTALLLRNTEYANTFAGAFTIIVDFAADALLLAFTMATLLRLSPDGLLGLLALGAMCGALLFGLRSRFRALSARSDAASGRRYLLILSTFQAIRELKSRSAERFFGSEIADAVSRHADAHRQNMLTQQVARPLIETIAVVGVLALIVVAVWQGQGLLDLIPELALFGLVTYRLMPAMLRLMNGLHQLEFMKTPIETIHAELTGTHERAIPKPAGATPPAFHDRLELRNVSFRYDGADRDALSDISLSIRRGQSIGIVGSSGAGKSTLADILLGLLRPDRGEILLDGVSVDAQSVAMHLLFGYVPQSPVLLDDTIERNIAFATEDGAIERARVRRALEMVQLADFVSGLPDGLATTVGERGVRLSGGQRQRLAIARALYHDPAILLMDEATSALDSLTEAEIAETIGRLHGQKTSIIIAHRLSTVQNCDRLILLDNGRIADAAPFDELVGRSFQFRRMVDEMRVGGGTRAAHG